MEQKAKAFNISAFEAADTATMPVISKNGDDPLMFDGQPVTITLYGPGSTQYAAATAKIETAQQARMFQALRGKTPKEGPAEQRQLATAKYVACTASINNFPVSAEQLYGNPKLGYITAQVAKFIEDWANF